MNIRSNIKVVVSSTLHVPELAMPSLANQNPILLATHNINNSKTIVVTTDTEYCPPNKL